MERGWQSHDSDKNLAMAICSEAGELAEILAWTGDEVATDKYSDLVEKIASELADIIILVVRLAALGDVDIKKGVEDYAIV